MSQFFALPREIRNKVYGIVSKQNSTDTPFSTFEIPWAFMESITNVETTKEAHADMINNKVVYNTVIKIPQEVEIERQKRAPAIIDHPLAFTCRQALAEYSQESRLHTGNWPALAFALKDDGSVWEARSSMDTDLVDMVLARRVMSVRVHCDLDHATDPEQPASAKTHSAIELGADFAKLFKNAHELEICIHPLVVFKEKDLERLCDLCNNGLDGEDHMLKSMKVTWVNMRISTTLQREELYKGKWVSDDAVESLRAAGLLSIDPAAMMSGQDQLRRIKLRRKNGMKSRIESVLPIQSYEDHFMSMLRTNANHRGELNLNVFI